jgi:hypothetical protein
VFKDDDRDAFAMLPCCCTHVSRREVTSPLLSWSVNPQGFEGVTADLLCGLVKARRSASTAAGGRSWLVSTPLLACGLRGTSWGVGMSGLWARVLCWTLGRRSETTAADTTSGFLLTEALAGSAVTYVGEISRAGE